MYRFTILIIKMQKQLLITIIASLSISAFCQSNCSVQNGNQTISRFRGKYYPRIYFKNLAIFTNNSICSYQIHFQNFACHRIGPINNCSRQLYFGVDCEESLSFIEITQNITLIAEAEIFAYEELVSSCLGSINIIVIDDPTPDSNNLQWLIYAGIAVAGVLVLVILICLIWRCCRKNVNQYSQMTN